MARKCQDLETEFILHFLKLRGFFNSFAVELVANYAKKEVQVTQVSRLFSVPTELIRIYSSPCSLFLGLYSQFTINYLHVVT